MPARRGRAAIILLGMPPLLSGCGLAVLNPQGPVGNHEATLLAISALLMCIVVFPVFFLTLFFAWRYRAGAPHEHYSPDWSYSRRIDIAVWTVPALIVLCLVIADWHSTRWLNPYQPIPGDKSPALRVDVVAMDWKWLFIYPDQGVASINQAVFPAGTQVDFRITSDSVMNAFFIPALGSQIYAMAGMMTQVHLLAKHAGTYRGFSANFSGPGFPQMHFAAIATSQAGFAGWLRRVKAAPAVLDGATYQMLAGPTVNTRAGYFGHVEPGLFADILAAHGGQALRLPREATE